MLHKEFWGILFLGFVAWVFIASNPQERIANVCRPVGWTGNVVVSVSALVLPDQQVKVQGYFDRFEYGCKYLTWRLFYQEQYNAWKASQAAAQAKETSATPAPTTPAAAPVQPNPSTAPVTQPAPSSVPPSTTK